MTNTIKQKQRNKLVYEKLRKLGLDSKHSNMLKHASLSKINMLLHTYGFKEITLEDNTLTIQQINKLFMEKKFNKDSLFVEVK